MTTHSACCAIALVLAAAVACTRPAPSAGEAGGGSATASVSLNVAPAVGADASATGDDAGPPMDVPTEVAAQHILIAYRGAKNAPKGVSRTKAEAKKRAEEVLARAKAGEDFSSLVKAYSDDPGSVDRQGSVGKFKRDKMDKAFADAAFALRVDEVSGVVETPFGFHIIKRNQ
jgi:NIMA-interacting peptidyl-prolyl cis-trans isomerase 1